MSLLFSNAHIDFWQSVGPIDFFNAQFIPDEAREGGGLEGVDGYTPPPELDDIEEATHWLGELPLRKDEHAVLCRVSLSGVPIQLAPRRARELVSSLVEIANDRSTWRLHSGAVAHSDRGWFGSFFGAAEGIEHAPVAYEVFNEGTGRNLSSLSSQFVQRLAEGDEVAEEAVEDARWVIAVAGAPTVAQRVALGTRALERAFSIARADGETWATTTARYLRAPWLKLNYLRWVQNAVSNARSGVAVTHGRGSATYGQVDNLLFPRDPDRHGTSYMSSSGLSDIEGWFGPLDALIAPGLISHRTTRDALKVLNDATGGSRWLSEAERCFDILLARLARARNAIIHGQRPSAPMLDTVDLFVADLGRLAARETMRSADTGQPQLAHLEHLRLGYAQMRMTLQTTLRPVELDFFRT